MKRSKLSSLAAADRRLGYAFLFPAMLFLTVFVFIPIANTLYMSLYEWKIFDLGKERVFVGLENFTRIIRDSVFGDVIRNTLLLVFVCLIVEVFLGLFISICLWNIKRSLRVVHAFILLPMIMAPVIVALIWRYIYDPLFGILNFVTKSLGLGTFAWLGDADLALGSIMVVDIWQMTSFVILILYAGLTVVPLENVESAMIDGASYLQVVRYILLPFISPLILLVTMIRTMDLLKIFDVVFPLTRGGPGSATETLSTYIYRIGFRNFEMGYASALSVVTLIGVLIMSLGFIKMMNPKKEKQ